MRSRSSFFVAGVATAVMMLAALTSSAVAAPVPWPPQLFTEFPADGLTGSGPGQIHNPRGIAASPVSGDLYVSDLSNDRIDQYTAWGEFIRAWGWGVEDGTAEFQVCDTATGCQAGAAGSGEGQLSNPFGIDVDSTGAVYVQEEGNLRVQKFSATGEFIYMVGGEVNKTKAGEPGATEAEKNICTAASGDECGVGTSGSGDGQFVASSVGTRIAVAPDNSFYVGDANRVQHFSAAGAFLGDLPYSAVTGLPARPLFALTVAPDGDLYLSFEQNFTLENAEVPFVFRVDPATEELVDEIEVPFARNMATDSAGNLYVVVVEKGPTRQDIAKVDSAGVRQPPNIALPDNRDLLINGLATSSACGVPADDLYATYFNDFPPSRSLVRGFGPAPDPEICPPPEVPPEITEQFAASVETTSAALQAKIDANFWNTSTTYYVEYGTTPCSLGGCTKVPVSPLSLGGEPSSQPVKTAAVPLAGLSPNTTYNFWFVAESDGGGPVKGLGGDEAIDGDESTFTTAKVPTNPPICPGQPFRVGLSLALHDCRAYEMVSPIDKNNGDTIPLGNINSDPASLDQTSDSGDRLTYSSYRAFADPVSAPFTNQYFSERGPESWSVQNISPKRNKSLLASGFALDVQYKAFTPDLCKGILLYDSTPPLDPAVPPGFASLYERDNCTTPTYNGLIEVEPPNSTVLNFVPEVQGISADASHVIFRAPDSLEEGAPFLGQGVSQLYETVGGGAPRLVCILPNGTRYTQACTAGTMTTVNINRFNNVAGAISADGSKIYWSDKALGPGKIYVRIDGAETRQVSTSAAQFWTASTDGNKALYSKGSDLYRYELDIAIPASTLIAGEVAGVMGASEDGNLVYLVSKEDLADGGEAGKPNLYLYDATADSFTFVAVLSADDARATTLARIPTPINTVPIQRSSRIAPDGQTAVFMSNASLTGADNVDLNSDEPVAEVFRYDAEAGELACISCNPTGARPTARNIEKGLGYWAGAKIQFWENQLFAPRVLSDDGDRVFFESFEPLVANDDNGKQDVYQWEELGEGTCTETDSGFDSETGGCVSLISTGTSNFDSAFVDANPTGRDVFFTTLQSLVPQDPGQVDIYDAREGGGLPIPKLPEPPCTGEGCQPPAPPAPPAGTPQSQSHHGPGNPPAPKPKKKCPKGKKKVKKGGKVRCVKVKKAGKQKNRASANRRAGR